MNDLDSFQTAMRSLEGLRFRTTRMMPVPGSGASYNSGLISTRLDSGTMFRVVFFDDSGHVGSADLRFPDDFNHADWHFYNPSDARNN